MLILIRRSERTYATMPLAGEVHAHSRALCVTFATPLADLGLKLPTCAQVLPEASLLSYTRCYRKRIRVPSLFDRSSFAKQQSLIEYITALGLARQPL